MVHVTSNVEPAVRTSPVVGLVMVSKLMPRLPTGSSAAAAAATTRVEIKPRAAHIMALSEGAALSLRKSSGTTSPILALEAAQPRGSGWVVLEATNGSARR